MKCRIAVISDIHYCATAPTIAARKGQWGAVLLRRTVERLNRTIKPDVTVVLGDLIDDPHDADASALLVALRDVLDRLDCPWLALPGNHDPSAAAFYNVFERVEHLDVNGVRLVSFVDAEEPGYNASRRGDVLERMAAVAADHSGPLVALQHVPVAEPGGEASYGYTNYAEVTTAMRAHGYTLALSGHYHPGVGLRQMDGLATMVVPALCEAPFSFALVTIDSVTIDGDNIGTGNIDAGNIDTEVLNHQLPASLGLNDFHSHTQFAYCGEDVSMTQSAGFAAIIGLNQLAFTEHSGQLYYDSQTYWSGDMAARGIDGRTGRAERMADYWRAAAPHRGDAVFAGLEVDADFAGNLVAEPADLEQADIVLGAVHWLPALRTPQPDAARAADEFLRIVDRLCRHGVDVLAHPFRVFRRGGIAVPTSLFAPTIALLREHGVAAEINFHTNEPPPPFIADCIEAGVRISFGSDAHALYEVGEFHPDLGLLADIGFDGDLMDILLPPLTSSHG
ncbi:MAG: metallophosphoesterase [Chloroflexota bacterium]